MLLAGAGRPFARANTLVERRLVRINGLPGFPECEVQEVSQAMEGMVPARTPALRFYYLACLCLALPQYAAAKLVGRGCAVVERRVREAGLCCQAGLLVYVDGRQGEGQVSTAVSPWAASGGYAAG